MKFFPTLRVRFGSFRHAAAINSAGIVFDDVATGEETLARRWLDVCTAGLPGGMRIVYDRRSRALLEDAAEATYMTGYCGRMWRFEDASRIVANERMETVL